MTLTEHRDWKKRHPDFPLTVHASGQWSKRVKGKVYYFGRLDDRDAALRQWLEEKDFLLAGVAPPKHGAGITVAELFEKHLEDVNSRIAAGRLALKTRKDYLVPPSLFRAAGLEGMPVRMLTPTHFAMVADELEKSDRTLRTQKNIIMAARAVFNWGGPEGMQLFDDRIRFGPRFKPPKSDAIEAEQEAAGIVRFLDREVILEALDTAKPRLKIAILLGINCAFYPGDTIAVARDHFHLDGEIPYHDFRRVKTRRQRKAVLWPETVAAIREYWEKYRRPKDKSERRLLLSERGEPHAYSGQGRSLLESFGRLLDRIGNRMKGVGLGSLRHTYATVVDSVPDQAMIDLTMGHTNKSIQKRTYRQLNLDELGRLKVLADRVWGWLYSGG